MSKETKTPNQLMLEDLARSGLSRQAAKLGCAVVTAETLSELTEGKIRVPGYRIPYYSVGKSKPGAFYRIKLTEIPPPPGAKEGKPKPGFAQNAQKATTDKWKPLKYWQPPNTLPAAYFCPLVKTWEALLNDPGKPLCITEGEKKAARACMAGINTIGLGGVWAWKSKKKDIPFIDDLAGINWRGRKTYLAFDNDLLSNHNVMAALVALGYALRERGAEVHIVKIPTVGKGKTGLDDYLESDADAGKEFWDLPTQPLAEDSELHKLNEELAYIDEAAGIYRIKERAFVTDRILTRVTHANRFISKLNSAGAAEKANAAEEWLRWEHRRTHRRLTYAPGCEAVLPDGSLNVWNGWGVQPAKGDISLWDELLTHLFSTAPQWRSWFEQWLAYPLQFPGTKLATSVLFHGLGHGTGKTFVGIIMGRIYGPENFRQVGKEHITRTFTDWQARRQFILGDEITGSEQRGYADHIRNIITREFIQVEAKYQPMYQLVDCTNWFLTSNHGDAQYLERDDRRTFVHEVVGNPLPMKFYAALDEWKNSEAGPAALFWWLLHKVNCAEFNAKGPAPKTEARAAMVELSFSDLDAFAERLRSGVDAILKIDNVPIKRDLWTVTELMELFTAEHPHQRIPSLIALSKALHRAGFRSRPVFTHTGAQRLFALRSQREWERRAPTEWAKHYAEHHGVAAPKTDEKTRLRAVK